jgi:hypothetical protein
VLELFTANFAAYATDGRSKTRRPRILIQEGMCPKVLSRGGRERHRWEEKLSKFLLYHSLLLND